MNAKQRLFEKIIKYIAYCSVILVAILMAIAVFISPTKEEAYTGDFSIKEIESNWILTTYAGTEEITLPYAEKLPKDAWVELNNVMPADVVDGMTLRVRSNMADTYIYIDGELRESYASDNFKKMGYYLPSAYVLCDLHDSDAGKPVCIRMILKGTGKLDKVVYGHGNNPWFEIIESNAAVVSVATQVALLGFISIVAYALLGKRMNFGKALFYLGMLMITTAAWILSESHIRQIYFNRPSMSSVFAYLSIELIGTFASLYFDEVQGFKYHRIYVVIESISVIQICINTVLHFAGIKEYYQTLIFSHIWMACSILCVIVTLFKDISRGRGRNYFHITAGMSVFVITCIGEIANFYLKPLPSYGFHICIGLVALLLSTIIQMATDTRKRFNAEETKRQEMTINTMETIASAIDAKDEYTGGHSYRVSEYAFIIASEMASEYKLTPKEIMRIRYVGLLHDIGKIAVAENILNKAGKLTDEEFDLMKKHTIIGYELLRGMDDVPWLLEGIKYHHERFDGRGYPDGLAGDDIPLVARILGLADAYDAMTSNRIYRPRLSDEEVRKEIERCAGTQFDPYMARIVCNMIDKGALRPITEAGYETGSTGRVLKSSILENVLRKDLQQNRHKVINPGSIKMVCYIAKLSEKEHHQIGMFFLGVTGENGEKLEGNEKTEMKAVLNKIIDKHIETKDVSVEYTESRELVVLFNRDNRESRKVVDAIVADCKGIVNVNVTEITKEMVETS